MRSALLCLVVGYLFVLVVGDGKMLILRVGG